MFKKTRVEKQKEETARWHETERIKEEGRKLREQKELELKRKQAEAEAAASSAGTAEKEEDEPPALGAFFTSSRSLLCLFRKTDPLDTTVRVKFTVKSHTELSTPSAIASLLSQFGATDVDSIVLSLKASKKGQEDKKPKYGTALVPFKQIGDAFAAVCASGRAERGLEGVEITWVGGKEPQILGWLKKMGKLGGQAESGRGPLEKQPAASIRGSSSSTPRGQERSSSQGQSRQPASGAGAFSSFPSAFVS